MRTKTAAGNWTEIFAGFRRQHAQWGGMGHRDDANLARNRVFDDVFVPGIEPKFRLDQGAPVFTIGSCFARNIELYLRKLGVPLADRYFGQKALVKEARASDSAIFNRFNVPSILYEAKAVADPGWLGDNLLYDVTGNWTYDAYFSPAQKQFRREEWHANRREILGYQNAFLRSVKAVFITLGLSEAVYDRETGMYLNGAPVLGKFNIRNNKRFEGRIVGLLDVLAMLDECRSVLRSVCGPELKIIMTVSPVPLEATFTGQDVVVANARSKATLRVAAQDFANAHDDVDYFPSYEMVTHSDPRVAFKEDMRHVTPETVAVIAGTFLEAYFGVRMDKPDRRPDAVAKRRQAHGRHNAGTAMNERQRVAAKRRARTAQKAAALVERQALQESIEGGDVTPGSLRRMSVLLTREGDMAGAVHWARRAVELTPRNAGALSYLGEVLAQSGDTLGARELLEKAVILSPNSVYVWRRYIKTLRFFQDQQYALMIARRAMDATGGDATVKAYWAGLEASAGDGAIAPADSDVAD